MQLAKIKVFLEQPEEAQSLLEEAVRQMEQTESSEYLRRIFFEFANALEKKGLLRDAYQMLKKAYKYQVSGSH